MKPKYVLLTAALAGVTLASSGCAMKEAKAETGQCHGVNACKGQGDCSGKGHSCGGKNECKGHGWVKSTQADCQTKGGQFTDNKGNPVASDKKDQ